MYVRYERLVLQAGDNAVTLRFHPRLTVIAGVGAPERDVLIAELLGGLAGNRAGLHLDLVDDVGRRVGIVRPPDGAPDRIIEMDTGEDVAQEFGAAPPKAGQAARVDVLRVLGLTVEQARRLCRLTAPELAVAHRADALVATLAALDPVRLWAAAERVAAAAEALETAAREANTATEDAPLVEELERRHAAFDAAQRRTGGTRHDAIFIAGACAPAAGIALALHSRVGALGFVAVAAITACVSVVFRRRAEAARRAELAALAELGAASYLGFQVQRMECLVGRRQVLARVAAASDEHRMALRAWQALAGDLDAEWVLAHRDAVTAMADHVRAGGTHALGPAQDVDPLKLAQWLVARFASAREVGATLESMPLFLDDPLVGLDPAVKVWALGLVSRFAGSPQVIYLTADRDVVAWARVEAIGGAMSVLDPAPEGASESAPKVSSVA